MFYLSFFRKTALWGGICFIVALCTSLVPMKDFFEVCIYPSGAGEVFCAFMFWSIPGYIFLSLMHIFVCTKILKDHRDGGEVFFGALGADLLAPFRSIVLFVLVITSKHVIKDDSEEHEFEDFVQVVLGFVWTVVLAIYILIGFLALTHFK